MIRASLNCIAPLLGLLLTCSASLVLAKAHPNLVHTVSSTQSMAEQYERYPLFNREVIALRSSLDAQLDAPLQVPLPKDAGGGYTHEQHKKNYAAIYHAGLLYQMTGDMRYAAFARDMLLEYAALYPGLGTHPLPKAGSPGRLFWQSLNEAVWLVHSIQGYDLIHSALSQEQRETIESGVLRPMAEYLSAGQPAVFNKVHNHGTWATAAVGMTGYVLNDNELVQQALYGLDKSGSGGFLKQLEVLFSPDGYYNEGPYYQRYALMPFVLFAKAIDNNNPERNIFAVRDGILLKAIYATVQLSYHGKFFPINDAIKDKGIDTTELLYGVAIAYGITGDSSLLSVAREQGAIALTGDGIALARDIAAGKTTAFDYRSMQFRDGAMGDKGALSVLRSGRAPGHMAVVMKNTSQGMGHGHFDKLSWLLYDNGNDIIPDYGAARFLNIEPKGGGHYLAENESWAKQSIAHSTLVVDEQSHFDGDRQRAEQHWPGGLQFATGDTIKIAAATMVGAYDDVSFSRAIAMVADESLEFPLIIDVVKAQSASKHQYDLPLHYKGQLINHNLRLQHSGNTLSVLGDDNGYQHLWVNARGRASSDADVVRISWINQNRFYSLSALASQPQELILTTLGANDPDFNLRQENAIIQRLSDQRNTTFVSLIEAHGEYNGRLEFTRKPYSQIAELDLHSAADTDLVYIKTRSGKEILLGLAFGSQSNTPHAMTYLDQEYRWHGFYQLFE